MADIISLPGTDCRHFIGGRCLYEERLNPGYTESWRCQVTTRWVVAYDDLLNRAESFGLGETVVSDIWRIQFQRLARQTFHCRNYVYCHGAEAPACQHHLDGLCITGLPRCAGRCRHYERAAGPDAE